VVRYSRRISKLSSFDFWDKATTLKEEYRKSVIFGINGKEEQININSVIEFIDKAVSKINAGLKKAIDPKTGLYVTYFRYEATKYQKNNERNHHNHIPDKSHMSP